MLDAATLILLDLEEMDKLQQEVEKNSCMICGKHIEEYEAAEFTGEEVVKTYKCPYCGFYGAQHYKLNYFYTEERK